jgi:NDP-sugar pyrophosphorylase family protein
MTEISPGSFIRGGIIAAGHGTRLRAGGYLVSKPMVPVAGRPLIELALERFRASGIRRLTTIINDASDDCRIWLADHACDFDLDLIVRTTPSSYASFQIVADRTAGAPAVIATVDSLMPVEAFCTFVRSAADLTEKSVALGLTDYVNDENPLWATLDTATGRILGLGGTHGTHVTAGVYWLPARRPPPPATNFSRLRDYLGWLVAKHQPVYGITVPGVFDIDTIHDIAAAEAAQFNRDLRDRGAV